MQGVGKGSRMKDYDVSKHEDDVRERDLHVNSRFTSQKAFKRILQQTFSFGLVLFVKEKDCQGWEAVCVSAKQRMCGNVLERYATMFS